ncbi:MAG: hypothetical protein ACWA5P_10895 [bacterium]
MILLFIIAISLVQFGLYYLDKKYKIKLPSYIILLTFLASYFFVFPKLFYPELNRDGINCGMPILGITFGFWIFGSIAAITTHIIWKVKNKKKQKSKTSNHN